jgi:hypothetical protein
MTFLPRKSDLAELASRGGLAALERRIASHVTINGLQLDVAPLILCVVGSTGEGKSFNVREILRRYGVAIHEVSCAALAHHKEGMALYPLIRTYRDASAALSEDRMAVVLLDDIDRSIASGYASRGHTVHSELLTGLFLDLCDDPYRIPHEDSRLLCDVQRVPIIFTANTVAGLDPALCRPQRMGMFAYDLEPGDRQGICERILLVRAAGMRSGLSAPDVKLLLRKYPDEPVAFFADVIGRFWNETCFRLLTGAVGKPLGRSELSASLAREAARLDQATALRLAHDERMDRAAARRSG